LFLGIELYGLSIFAIAMMVSTLMNDRNSVKAPALSILALPSALVLYAFSANVEQFGNNPFSGFFCLGYTFPNFGFAVILAEYYI
jgi:hypothetical protein